MQKTTLSVQGMKCEGCAQNVEEALMRVEDVRSVEVSLEDMRAEVTTDGPAKLERLLAAVQEAGYQARPGA